MAKSYLLFETAGNTGKTYTWNVKAASGLLLGQIKWFSAWRRYCLFPEKCVFDVTCLREVITFIDEEMQKRKK